VGEQTEPPVHVLLADFVGGAASWAVGAGLDRHSRAAIFVGSRDGMIK
jgi:hypothetical protein